MNLSRLLTKGADVASCLSAIIVAPIARLHTVMGPDRLPLTYKWWDTVGVTPIPYHYHQPIQDWRTLPESTWQKNPMHGIDFRVDEQLNLLREFHYKDELLSFPIEQPLAGSQFFYNNPAFASGDAEIYYSLIRHIKPRRIVEIGAGYSTLLAELAIRDNRKPCEHTCIEPYENKWLDAIPTLRVVRSRVEDIPVDMFRSLDTDDILFIDSSHVVRPGGDVCFEYLQILPILRRGVYIHIHDIFLPFGYPKAWMTKHRRYWTEQYLLQALLQNNHAFEVILALYFLSKEHHDDLARACPVYGQQPRRDPGSFWMRRS